MSAFNRLMKERPCAPSTQTFRHIVSHQWPNHRSLFDEYDSKFRPAQVFWLQISSLIAVLRTNNETRYYLIWHMIPSILIFKPFPDVAKNHASLYVLNPLEKVKEICLNKILISPGSRGAILLVVSFTSTQSCVDGLRSFSHSCQLQCH